MAETTTQPFELTLEDGSVVKAASVDEAVKILAKMKTDTSSALRDEKTKREALEARVQGIEAAAAEARKPKPAEGQFNNDKYYEILNRDPVAAANYVDSFRFGIGDPAQVPTVFQTMQRDVSVTRQEAMAAQFMQQHAKDFPQTGDAAKALRVQFEGYLSQGYPATVETLNLAYNHAINEGHIKPLEIKEQKEEIPPNPSLNGAGAAGLTDTEMQKVDQMSDKELEAYLKSKNLL